MFKQINIMLCFLMFFAFDKVTAQDNFEIFIPDFIQSNSSFEISIITSKTFPEAEKLDIFISPDISLIINKVSHLKWIILKLFSIYAIFSSLSITNWPTKLAINHI